MKYSNPLTFLCGTLFLLAANISHSLLSAQEVSHDSYVASNLAIANDLSPTAAKKLVVFDVTRLSVDLNSTVAIKSFFKAGSFEIHTGSIPSIDLDTKFGSSNPSKIDNPNASTTRVATASDAVRRAMPVMLGKLDDTGLNALIKSLDKDSVSSLPPATCQSGSLALVDDTTLRPFVVGVKPIVGDFAIAHQPVVHTIEEGLLMRFKPSIKVEKVDLETDLVHTQISDVQTFTVSGTANQGVTVQIPEQTLKQVRLDTTLEDGETLFIDPCLRLVEEQRQEKKGLLFGKVKVTRAEKQIYFLVTPRIVIESEKHTNALTQMGK